MYDRDAAPTDAQVAQFAYLSPMLDSALSEMREFAKKKQDGIVSATKIRLLNRLLTDIQGILRDEASLAYLELLPDETLPQNSDAVLVLGQYRAALDSFVKRHQATIKYQKTWITKEWIDQNTEPADDEDEEDDDDIDEDDDIEDDDDIDEDDDGRR